MVPVYVHLNLLMIKRDSDLYKQHLQYEIRDYFLPEKIGKHALIWEQYQKWFQWSDSGDEVGRSETEADTGRWRTVKFLKCKRSRTKSIPRALVRRGSVNQSKHCFFRNIFSKKNEQKSAGCGDRKSVAIVVKINFLDRFYFFGLFFRLLSVFAFFGCKVMKIGGYETDFFDFGLSVLVLCC